MTTIASIAAVSGNSIVRDNLKLYYDPYLSQSYSGSGTTLNDLSGQTNTGTLQNSPTFSTTYFTFDGTNDYISTATNLAAAYTTFTYCAWFRTTTASGKPIINYEYPQTGEANAVYYSNKMYVGTDGKLYGGVHFSAPVTKASANTVTDGQWHFGCVTVNNTTKVLTLYLDGVSEGTSTGSGTFLNSSGYYRVGAYNQTGWTGGANGYFPGEIGAVQIYDTDLSEAQIKQNYYARLRSMPLRVPITYLVIAGGGGGGVSRGGGGGAGGYRSSVAGENSGGGTSAESVLSIVPLTNYTVTVGAGGPASTSGNNSVFSSITSTAGGYGGYGSFVSQNGSTGGSGGGGGAYQNPASGAAGTAGQGYAGGNGYNGGGEASCGGGGGGASAAGSTPTASAGGKGGNGVSSSITGVSVTRGGGGAGGLDKRGYGGSVGAAGTGGGGTAASDGGAGGNGTANTGGGGGGGGINASAISLSPGSGGSGIVILRWPTSSGTITVGAGLTYSTTTSGSNTIATFTAGTGNVSWS